MQSGVCNVLFRPPIFDTFPVHQTAAKEESIMQISPVIRLSSRATSRTAMRPFYLNNFINLKITSSIPSRSICESDICVSTSSKAVDTSMHKIISGYWIGPDIEDGWGYIEAAVDQSG